MATTSKYYVLTPSADNLDFLDFDLRYGSVTTVGESVQYNGTSKVDSIFVRPGLSYDLSNTSAGIDKIYLTGNLSDYTGSVNGTLLNLSRTVNGNTESVTVSGGTSFNFDNLIFGNGTVATNALYNAVKNATALPAPSLTETSLAPIGAAAPLAPLNATVKAYSTNTAGVGLVGETFASTRPGISLVVNGGSGIDTVYVADGEKVDATVLGGSVDLVYFRGTWADYTKSVLPGGTQLLFTRTIGGNLESVTVTAGTSFNHDKLIFADGAITTDLAKTAITTVTPLYPDDAVLAAINAIRDAAQNNSATATTPSALTYQIAGVSGVSGANLASVNSALNSALINGVLADTAPEIQTIVNAYGAILGSADGVGGNTATPLTGTQYSSIGVTGVSGTAAPGNALFLLDDVVDRSAQTAVDSEPEVQAIADAANHVMAAAGGTGAEAAALTLTDLMALGLSGVSASNLAAVQAAVRAASSDSAVDTRAELQALVNVTNIGSGSAVNLNNISTGTGGFAINGATSGSEAGLSVSEAGDVNGDGLGDLLVGAPRSNSNAGEAYVVFGKADTTAVNLSSIIAGNGGGYKITGVANELGWYVNGVGDVNNDGLSDQIICDYTVSGKAYVVYGKANTTAINVSDIANGTGGFVINGFVVSTDVTGIRTLDSAGDVNGDGLIDYIIGSPGVFGFNNGSSYVVFGKSDNAAVDLNSVAAGTGGFALNGGGILNGRAVASAGDVNNDGLSDLLVSAIGSNISYVVYGKTSTNAIDLGAVAAGTGGFALIGNADAAGSSLASAGDVNGDGFVDFLIGANGYGTVGPQIGPGAAYVVFGKATNTTVSLTAVDAGVGGFSIRGQANFAYTGTSVSSAGDMNGDGLADMLVGAYYYNNVMGRAYVVYGKTGTAAIDLNTMTPSQGFFINPASTGTSLTGYSVSGAGDVNGDGLDDLIVGAYGANDGTNTNVGVSYVILGGSQFASTLDFVGDANANTLVGTSTAETFAAGAGNDMLIGNGGADVMYGGAGNDTFVLNTSNATALQNVLGAGGNTTQLSRLLGGTGIDTIQLTGGAGLDMTLISNQSNVGNLSRINGVEIIDLKTDTAANALTLRAVDVIDMSETNLFNSSNTSAVGGTALAASVGKHQLMVFGDAFDTVNIGVAGWTNTGTVVGYAGHNLVVYNNNTSAAQMFIEQTIVNASHVL